MSEENKAVTLHCMVCGVYFLMPPAKAGRVCCSEGCGNKMFDAVKEMLREIVKEEAMKK
jgi:predicted nucleic acid-binding Zn ribbon protein